MESLIPCFFDNSDKWDSKKSLVCCGGYCFHVLCSEGINFEEDFTFVMVVRNPGNSYAFSLVRGDRYVGLKIAFKVDSLT